MVNGPQRLILIKAGRYDYADVELSGSLQIVGPNNTGKTTLINTLQFLYIDDRRHMDFGSYTPEQTRDYYFPNQYSYVLFELLGARGKCVLGWRGQNRIMGAEPERFLFEGPFDPADFLDEDYKVREPKAVDIRLSLKQYTLLKTAQEHRELLLMATKGDLKGIGLVALRDNDRYPQFRETLKNLLCLSTISQYQMRNQLLMLAGLPLDGHALNIRELFGDDYDLILSRRQKHLCFKKCQKQIEQLVATSARRDELRSELTYRWTDLFTKRQAFEHESVNNLEKLRKEVERTQKRVQELSDEIGVHHAAKEKLAESKGSILSRLNQIAGQTQEFSGFLEGLARTAVKNMEEEVRHLERQLDDSQGETRDKVKQKLERSRELVTQAQRAITSFDRALVSVLRRDLNEEQLSSLSRLFNFDLLEQPVGDDGISLRRPNQLINVLRLLSSRIQNNVYRDGNIELPLLRPRRNLDELENVANTRERLVEEEQALSRHEGTLAAIEHRDSLLAERDAKHADKEASARRLYRFEEYQRIKAEEPLLAAELKQTKDMLTQKDKLIQERDQEIAVARKEESSAEAKIKSEQNEFDSNIRSFAECLAPAFSASPKPPEATLPDDFSASVEQYLGMQKALNQLDQQLNTELLRLEAALGPDYAGIDELATIRLLREELEALPEREEVLGREWEHQLTNVQATFDQVLRSVADISSAADRLNRALSNIQISNLAALSMEVQEQTDIVGWMRRLAKIEQPGLFEEGAGLDATVAAFRQKFESNPLLRYPDLFTLRFTVTGDDGKPHYYHDFRQVESDGTTIAIKVLFNLLVLRSLLREDPQRNLLCEVPFFLDEIHSLDAVNRHAVLTTARKLGFIAIIAAPESVSEVDALYFLQPQEGRIVLKNRHRMRVMVRQRGV
jgi:hypothetical protein